MNIDFNKSGGLVPVIIQEYTTNQVLMLGYMNEPAYNKTISEDRVTFYSRSKKRLWTKGESSGNYLQVKSVNIDCDGDTILIKAIPAGPTCHKGTDSCFATNSQNNFIYQLEKIIDNRIEDEDDSSYTYSLFEKGVNKIAQKVGEEAVELVIEAKDNNDDLFKGEAADLIYHFLVLLRYKGLTLKNIEEILRTRHSIKN